MWKNGKPNWGTGILRNMKWQVLFNFEIEKHTETTFGSFLTGRFLEKPPLFASDQKFRLGEFEFEIWGMPKGELWTLQLVSEKVFNWVLEEQVVRLEFL